MYIYTLELVDAGTCVLRPNCLLRPNISPYQNTNKTCFKKNV